MSTKESKKTTITFPKDVAKDLQKFMAEKELGLHKQSEVVVDAVRQYIRSERAKEQGLQLIYINKPDLGRIFATVRAAGTPSDFVTLYDEKQTPLKLPGEREPLPSRVYQEEAPLPAGGVYQEEAGPNSDDDKEETIPCDEINTDDDTSSSDDSD